MSENNFQAQSAREQISYHRQKLDEINKGREKLDADASVHQAIIDHLTAKLSTMTQSFAEVVITPVQENKKRPYPAPGVIEKSILDLLAEKSEGITIPEIHRTLQERGYEFSRGSIDNNIRALLEDYKVEKINPEDKMSVKYRLSILA